MNSRRPKVWHTEDQILAAIERTKRSAMKALMKSKLLEEKAKEKFGRCEEIRFELMKASGLSEYQKNSLQAKLVSAERAAGEEKEKADKCAASYHRAINSTLPRLGEILSAFRTPAMAAIVGDYKGVAVR